MGKKETYDLIGNIANAFGKTGDVLKAFDLANVLNLNGHKTTSGKTYSPNGRGIFKTIAAAYKAFEKKGDKETATNIASAFTNKNGKQSWK